MFARFLVALGVLAVAIDAFHGGIRLNRGFSVKLRNSEVCGSAVKAIPLSMATDGDDVGVVVKQSDDISKYSVGQTLNGELVSSKDFGIFVFQRHRQNQKHILGCKQQIAWLRRNVLAQRCSSTSTHSKTKRT